MRELIGTLTYPRVGHELALEYSRVYAENGKNVLVFRLVNHSKKTVTDYTVDVDFYADGRPQLQTVRRSGLFIAPEGTSEEHELIISAEADEGELRIASALYDDFSYSKLDVTVPFATSEAISRMANQILENPAQYAKKIREYDEAVARLESPDATRRESKTAYAGREEAPAQQAEQDYEPIMKDTNEEPDYRPAPKRRGVKRYVLLALAFLLVSVSNIVPLFTNTYFDSSAAFDYAWETYEEIFYDTPNYVDGILLLYVPHSSQYHVIALYGNNISDTVTSTFNSMFSMYSSTDLNYSRVYYNTYANNSGYYGDNFEHKLPTRIESITNSLSGTDAFRGYYSNVAPTPPSPLYNRTATSVDYYATTSAIHYFTNETGVPLAVVIDSPENMLAGRITDDERSELIVLSLIAILGLSLLIKAIRNSRFNKDQRVAAGLTDEKTGTVTPLVMAIVAFALALLIFLSTFA